MFLKLQPIFYSLIFFGGLEAIILKPDLIRYILLILLILAFFQGKKVGGQWFFSILPVFFTLSSLALLYLISILIEQQIFIVLVTLMYYLSLLSAYRLGQYAGDQTAKGMNMAASSATIFFTYASAYGLYLNFDVPLYWLMLVYLLVTLLVSFQYFSIIENDSKKVWTFSFLLALLMVEIVWAINYWPFGYLTTGVIALILYYILWDLVQSYFLNLLSRKRVTANMIFFSFLIIMVLLSAKWTPVI